ncbi:CU044_5270 family protein [Streptomyces sp. NPDC087425]|uniref:CU044_5270 family protein n=1 Tax=Streptomyces sp. NPDC087425 TaxID=3365787 RepID=UPI003803934B
MTDRTSGHRPEQAELEELASLLPFPAERDLPPGRHLHHKETLMNLIDKETDEAPAHQPATPRPHVPHVPHVPRFRRPALLLPAAGLALTTALLTTLTLTNQNATTSPPSAKSPSTDTRTGARTGTGTAPHDATLLLDRIATVAAKTAQRPVTASQFVYVRTLQTGNDGKFGGPLKLTKAAEREVWMSQKPGAVTDVGLIHEDGAYWPITVGVPDGEAPVGYPAGLNRPTYAWLASLPTAPDALLDRLSKEITRDQDARDTPTADRNRAQDAFDTIGELLRETVMPPRTAAALYQAAAKIPGVTEDPDAKDAAGRHGIGVARDNTRTGERTAWIFDPTTLAYLGERTYLTRDTTLGKKGALLHVSAVLERGVVNALREQPPTKTT